MAQEWYIGLAVLPRSFKPKSTPESQKQQLKKKQKKKHTPCFVSPSISPKRVAPLPLRHPAERLAWRRSWQRRRKQEANDKQPRPPASLLICLPPGAAPPGLNPHGVWKDSVCVFCVFIWGHFTALFFFSVFPCFSLLNPRGRSVRLASRPGLFF